MKLFKKKKGQTQYRSVCWWSDLMSTGKMQVSVADGKQSTLWIASHLQSDTKEQTDLAIDTTVFTFAEDSEGVFKFASKVLFIVRSKEDLNEQGLRQMVTSWFRKNGITISSSLQIDVKSWNDIKFLKEDAFSWICTYIGHVLISGGWTKSAKVEASVWGDLRSLAIDGDKQWQKNKDQGLIIKFFSTFIEWTDKDIYNKLNEEGALERDVRALHRYLLINRKSSAN